MLDGKILDNKKGLYSLIDSTPESHPTLGEAFHIYIPYIVVYGYPWSRSGEIQVLDGTFLNLRAFTKKYGDYSGGFMDNPYTLKVIQRPLPGNEFMPDTIDTFKDIAEEGSGEAVLSKGGEDLIKDISKMLDKIKGERLDLVVAIDTTRSMLNDINFLQKDFMPLVLDKTKEFKEIRVGMVLYKDYFEEYVTKALPFHDDFSQLQTFLNSIRVLGGRDIPEAVYEALYTSIHAYEWEASNRMIILIGDAPPHPRPRGKIRKEKVYKDAMQQNIIINTIILPQ
jgi:hypothetical protein